MLITAQAFPPASGGIEDLMRGLALHAAAAGRDVRVLADARSEDREFDLAARSTAAPFMVERFGGLKPWRRWRKARRVAALGRQARAEAGGVVVGALAMRAGLALSPRTGGGGAAAIPAE